MQRHAKGDGDNKGMKTITNIADQLFRKVEPVDSAFGSEAAEAAVEGTAGQTGAQTKSQTGAAFPRNPHAGVLRHRLPGPLPA